MRTIVLSLIVLAVGMLRASGQEPAPVPDPVPPPAPAPESAPVPAPAPVPVPQAPPLLITPRETDLLPIPPHFGPPPAISPAHRLAMMEAGEPLFANDPRVQSAAVLLERLTARYVEDAPRISALTVRVCGQVRAANHPASPFEMLDGALHWPRPATLPPGAPRQFERFAGLYNQARVVNGLDHAAAISALSVPR